MTEEKNLLEPVFTQEPRVNVISKEEFSNRVQKVFHLLWETLARSFGPYGAPTLIYNYPFSHVTKDGFTIMKNLSMDASTTLLDQAIANMASDICGRLNYTVGDGTTTAVIATNSVYEAYKKDCEDNVVLKRVKPRDIIKEYEKIKDEVVEALQAYVKQIRSDDREVLKNNIAEVVSISSNGDEVITEYISDLYKELGCPGITSVLAPDGITKKKLIDGYKYEIGLNDRLYINSDEDKMILGNTDIIILSHKVSLQTYDEILVPLSALCKMRNRHLIVAAPLYDEVAIVQKISKELRSEYKKSGDINMVLMTYKNSSANARRLVEDFAILCNTEVMSLEKEKIIRDEIKRGVNYESLFNLDNRGIDGTIGLAIDLNAGSYKAYEIGNKEDEAIVFSGTYKRPENDENSFRLGFIDSCKLGMDSSLFTGKFYYNEKLYKAALEDAENTLKEKEKKYQKLGTFNVEVSQAQDRLYALKLKMGTIEVGADSELSQKLLRDSVDDAIKAATSAFNHGVVLGCNVSLIEAIDDVINKELNKEDISELKVDLLKILRNGFVSVYKTVLGNAFTPKPFDMSDIKKDYNSEIIKEFVDTYVDKSAREEITSIMEEVLEEEIEAYLQLEYEYEYTLSDLIVDVSTYKSQVFDLSTGTFNDKVINSVETDEQVLKAIIDLITLLMTGNQVVVTQKNNF